MALEINGRGRLAGLGPGARPRGLETARTGSAHPDRTCSEGLAAYRPDRGAPHGPTVPLSQRLALRAGDVPDSRQETRAEEKENPDRAEWNEEFFASFFDWRDMLWAEDEVQR